MNQIVKPGSGLLFMKIGTHANESLADIIARKAAEIRDAGFGMWGYGGNTCHPRSMVQPFAEAFADKGPIYLCMEAMQSNHFAEGVAAEYSHDGSDWKPIPDAIEVRGSKYAMIIEDLHEEHFKLPLDQTRVPVGPSLGRIGSRYVQGRVDKACLEVLDAPELANDARPRQIDIHFVARTKAPYAVFLRGQR